MRHALVPVHLIHSARAAAATYARYDDGPESDESSVRPSRRARRPRRFAARTRRTHPYPHPAGLAARECREYQEPDDPPRWNDDRRARVARWSPSPG